MPTNRNINNFVIIGSSRGLGAALANELLKNPNNKVFGTARSSIENSKVKRNDNYVHIQLDIINVASIKPLSEICLELSDQPVCVIFNAVSMVPDVNSDLSINFDSLREINNIGIIGLSNVLNAFETYLVAKGGIFVGISSFSAFAPTIYIPRIAYPASKAYLNMALRSLRFIWKDKVAVTTVNLGHMKEPDDKTFGKSVPCYSDVAQVIVNNLTNKRIKVEINYPLIYSIVYKKIINFIPDSLYFSIFKVFLKLSKVKSKRVVDGF